MRGVAAAVGFETLKLCRSPVVWTATVALVGLFPLLASGLLWAARSSSDSQLAAKVRTMATETGWSGQFAVTGQIFSVAVLIVVGIVVCWIFGREFADGTVGALVSLPVPRHLIAAAKFVVLSAWAAMTCVLGAVTTVILGLARIGALPSGADGWGLGRLLLVALLTVALTIPLGLAASLGRGYFPGIGVLFGLLVLTQVISAAGLGGWFPYAAPGLWIGMGGPEVAARITTGQLLSPLMVGVVALAGTLAWWRGKAPAKNV